MLIYIVYLNCWLRSRIHIFMNQSVHRISGVLHELEFRLRKFTRRLIVGDNSSDYAVHKREMK